MSHREQTKLAKGFIMNKMYTLGYIAARHTSTDNLPKSCPPELKKYVREAIQELRRERLLNLKPTSYGGQASAVMTDIGREYANVYRRYVNLPKTDFNPPQRIRASPLTDAELRQLRQLRLRKRKS